MLVSSSQGFLSLAFVVRLCEAAGPRPKMEWDPNTISSCIEWYDNGGTETCEYIRDMFGITPEDFHAWNPSIGLDCKPWYPVSYCILTREKWASFTSTARVSKTTSTTSTTSTSVSTHVPSPTAWEALGCYTDDDPAWPVMEKEYSKEGGDTSLKVSDCQSTCWAASVNRTVLYAGVKEGNQCWCSRFVAGETSRNETDCNLPCSGDKTEICGGKGRLNVFAPVTASESPRSSTTTSVSSITTTAKDSSTSATATDRVTSGSVINSATPSSGAMRYRAMFGLFD